MKILVINGPNINMLGLREPEIYGAKSYKELARYIKSEAKALGVRIKLFQSNSEGKIVTRIQRARKGYDAIIINPAAYTHTSIAIPDALKAVGLRAVEVHLSDISSREDFRKISYTSPVCVETFAGLGFEGYKKALALLAQAK